MKEEKSIMSKFLRVFSKIALVVGTIWAFYELPSIVAEKISYKQLKKKQIMQDLTEEE